MAIVTTRHAGFWIRVVAYLSDALVRRLVLFISIVVCFIGVIWVAFDPQKQGWHDKVASTDVVAT